MRYRLVGYSLLSCAIPHTAQYDRPKLETTTGTASPATTHGQRENLQSCCVLSSCCKPHINVPAGVVSGPQCCHSFVPRPPMLARAPGMLTVDLQGTTHYEAELGFCRPHSLPQLGKACLLGNLHHGVAPHASQSTRLLEKSCLRCCLFHQTVTVPCCDVDPSRGDLLSPARPKLEEALRPAH